MRRTHSIGIRLLAGASLCSLGVLAATGAGASPGRHPHRGPVYRVQTLLAGASLDHTFVPSGSSTSTTEPLSHPDDLTRLGTRLFVGFQNGVGPQGEPSTSGNLDSTVVEFTLSGRVLGQWDVVGKVDGLGADPQLGGVIATVNEDANSSLYTIQPWASPSGVVTGYAYDEPLPHAGGTDAVTVDRGRILISASAPGTSGTAATPSAAVYAVRLDASTHVATVQTLFNDQDSATVANVGPSFGTTVTLALTDPDSNALVPAGSPRFGGDFELTSQGDLKQIYVSHPGSARQHLWVLSLSQAVDDTAWPTSGGRWQRLVATDSTNDAVDVVTGDFDRSQPVVAATPCDANTFPTTCNNDPATPVNYLATLDPRTGTVTALDVEGVPFVPQGGLLLVAAPHR